MERKSLFTVTRELLDDRPRKLTLAKIAEDIGVRYAWLVYLGQDKCKDSASMKVQKLYEYLSGDKLDY